MNWETNLQALVGLFSGVGGAILLRVLQWWVERGDKAKAAMLAQEKLDQAKAAADLEHTLAIQAATDTLGTQIRAELRVDNLELRTRLGAAEALISQQAATIHELELAAVVNRTKIDGLTQENVSLRAENLMLSTANGAAAARLQQLEAHVAALQADRLTLLDLARAAGVTIPPLQVTLGSTP